MEISNVIVIINPEDYTLREVRKDIKEEGYQHNFCFVNYCDPEQALEAIDVADEIWLWGDCTDLAYYKHSKKLGKDIWQMAR